MGANQSLPTKQQSRYVLGQRNSLSSIASSRQSSPSIIQHSTDLVNSSLGINAAITIPVTQHSTLTERSLNPSSIISEKRKEKLPFDTNRTSSVIIDRSSGHSKRVKSYSNNTKSSYRERYNSTFTASSISNADGFQFSTIDDSAITDMSRISFNSFMDNKHEDNDYIMHVPDYEYPTRSTTNTPSTEQVSTTQEILDLLSQNQDCIYDILTDLFSSSRIRSNPELQREAFHAVEVWSARPDDVSAKICVARLKLCGWGTPKDSRQGFKELKKLAEKQNWQAYYYLAQCYYYGVEQATEGYTMSNSKSIVIQSVDQDLACVWYKKVIDTPCHIQSDRIPTIVAQAKLMIAVTHFMNDKITRENLEENIGYIKDSATAGNRKSEFLLALLLRTEQTTDPISYKEYYIRSSNKGYAPSQLELGLILLRENSSEAIQWLTKASKLGESRAYYNLGLIYEFGLTTKIDFQLACKNYQIGADNFNNVQCQSRLAFHYASGTLDLKKDDLKAFTYLTNAARHHYPAAQYCLGIMYRDTLLPGPDTVQNKKHALALFRAAASQQFHPAITAVANCFQSGIGTSIDRTTAIGYYQKAISIPGHYLPSAQLAYAIFLHKIGKYEEALKLYFLASGLTSSELNTAPPIKSVECSAKLMIALFYLDRKNTSTPYRPNEGFDMLMQLTKQDPENGEVHYWIAVCYEEGVPGIVQTSQKKAFEHYMISAKLDFTKSQVQVGHMLCQGTGIEIDRVAAFEYLHAAAQKNSEIALYYVAVYYYHGSGGIPRDLDRAREYFKRSAQLGKIEAIVSYAQMCHDKYKENTLPQCELDTFLQQAIIWYKKAAKQNNTTALRELGHIYGSKKDYKVAAEYYERASQLNDALSTVLLGGYYEKGHGVKMNQQTAMDYYHKAIDLNQPTALFAIAELYDKLKTYDQAYTYYERVIQDTRVSKNSKSRKMSRFKIALYCLNYDSLTLLRSTNTTEADVAATEPVNIHHVLNQANTNYASPTEAFSDLKTLAVQDKFTDAYFWIAQCYKDGNGVPRNTNSLLYWLDKAFKETHDMNATMELASIYQHGLYGVEVNARFAFQLFQLLGERNIVVGQHQLGVIFWRGLEMIPINLGMAVIWFTRAARQGYSPSHWALGQIALENGDLHIAIAWWESAMKLNPVVPHLDHHYLLTTTGDSDALIRLGKIFQQQQEEQELLGTSSMYSGSTMRDEVESLSRVQQENNGLAVRCFGQAALMGNVLGMYLTAEAWHKDKDYPVALENYEKAASQGHIPSRIMCATYQIYGLGGKQINTVAGYQELLDCAKSDTDAYIHLGRCCERGLGTNQDLSKALEWYHLSIKTTNSSEAMFRVGQIYAQQKIESESMFWYQQAIDKDGHPRAHFRIAFYYIQGIFDHLLSPDLSKAVYHFRAAAKQNDQDAMFELGQLLLTTKDNTCALFPIDLQQEGLSWFQIAADKGSSDAQRELGNLYHSGREGEPVTSDEEEDEDEDRQEDFPILIVSQDFEKAYDHFSFAAHLGDQTSALFLGTYYEHGICVPPNIELAQTWYTVAVELGLSNGTGGHLPLSHPAGWWPAQLCLARVLHQTKESQEVAYALFHTLYYCHRPEQHMDYLEWMLAYYELNGLGGISIQEKKAVSKFIHLAEKGYTKAFFQVAQSYEHGIGVARDLDKALSWYVALIHHPVIDQDSLDADDQDDLSRAYFCLAEYYRLGKVVSVNQEKAMTLYQIAAERGSKEAKNYLQHSF